MIFNIIVAVCNDNGIGINNTIPWYSKEDMRHFAQITKGNGSNVVVMGHNTWNSIPDNKKPLVDRENIVLSKNKNLTHDNCIIKHSVEDVIKYLEDKAYETCWIIGGGAIYEQFLKENIIDNIIITRINETHTCSIFFPPIPSHFELTITKELDGTPHSVEYYTHFKTTPLYSS